MSDVARFAQDVLEMVTNKAIEDRMPQHQVAAAITTVAIALVKATARPGMSSHALYAAATEVENAAIRAAMADADALAN